MDTHEFSWGDLGDLCIVYVSKISSTLAYFVHPIRAGHGHATVPWIDYNIIIIVVIIIIVIIVIIMHIALLSVLAGQSSLTNCWSCTSMLYNACNHHHQHRRHRVIVIIIIIIITTTSLSWQPKMVVVFAVFRRAFKSVGLRIMIIYYHHGCHHHHHIMMIIINNIIIVIIVVVFIIIIIIIIVVHLHTTRRWSPKNTLYQNAFQVFQEDERNPALQTGRWSSSIHSSVPDHLYRCRLDDRHVDQMMSCSW